MEDLLIKTEEIGKYRIKVYYDTDAQCPCVDWDLCALHLFGYSCSHRLYRSCNVNEFEKEYGSCATIEDAVCKLIRYHIGWMDLFKYLRLGKISGCSILYDRSHREWCVKFEPSRYCDIRFTTDEVKNSDIPDDLLDSFTMDESVQILNDLCPNLYAATWSSTGYSQGDYVEGIAFCTRERYDELCGRTDIPWREAAQLCIDSEVADIGMWLWGDVKRFTLEQKVHFTKVYDKELNREPVCTFEYEEIDSCCGYFMDTDEVISEVINEHNLAA